MSFRAFSSRGSSLLQTIAETCVRFDAAHLSINLVSEIAVPMFPTLSYDFIGNRPEKYGAYGINFHLERSVSRTIVANSSAVSDFIWCLTIDDILYCLLMFAAELIFEK